MNHPVLDGMVHGIGYELGSAGSVLLGRCGGARAGAQFAAGEEEAITAQVPGPLPLLGTWAVMKLVTVVVESPKRPSSDSA